MIIGFLVAILIVRYLKKSFETAEKLPGWDKIFTFILYGSAGLLVLSFLNKPMTPVFTWVAHGVLLYLLYILYSKTEFGAARSYMVALAPYILVSIFRDLVKLISGDFYDSWHGVLDGAVLFSIVWLVAMLIINRKQQKALEQEKLRTKQEEDQNKIIGKKKDELEVQVAERTAEITQQKEALQKTLDELKSTQSQLIQSEKMASLGELTAGIAHEIQNPLNFVNNFSEVNAELIAEMKIEIEKGNLQEVKALAIDIADNEQKINHHGKRADAIVKGMLQHSRISSGTKEPTNINDLADEYLRLAYHGLRAKDKTFNATLKTDFDTTIGKMQIVPQDIGRVILNLITNAFYAVKQKKSAEAATYNPTVSVSTKKQGNKILISVKDNGGGIPAKILDKIFQPFFTTKPTGDGTGLGLSLSYDIVKTHGGELKVETKEGEGAEFIIILPQ